MGFIIDPKPVSQGVGIAVLIVNILIPGVGTVVYSLSANDPRWMRAILQFVGSIIIIGWISAVIDGVKVLLAANKPMGSMS